MPSTLWMVTCNRYLTISSSSFFLFIVSCTLYYSSLSICGVSSWLPFLLISWIVLTSRFCFDCQIHDSDMITGHFLEKFINGPAHHTLHHLYFTVNYGQVSLVLLAFLWFWLHTPVLYVGWSCWRIVSSPRFCTGSSDGCEVDQGRMKNKKKQKKQKRFNNAVYTRASYQLILIPNAVAVYESRSVIL